MSLNIESLSLVSRNAIDVLTVNEDIENKDIDIDRLCDWVHHHPQSVTDRGYLLTEWLHESGCECYVSSQRFNDGIHLLISQGSDKFAVVGNETTSYFSRDEYIDRYGYLHETPLSASLEAMKEVVPNRGEQLQWADSPLLVVGQFERVGSSWFMDVMNQIGRSQVEPLRQHVSLSSPLNSFSHRSEQIDSEHFHGNLKGMAYSNLWFRNFLSAQYQSELQVIKETNLYFMLPFFLQMFPEHTPTVFLKRDFRGILSSFKKGSLYQNWEYLSRFKQLKELVAQDDTLDKYRPFFESTDEENWRDVLMTLYIVNVSQINDHLLNSKPSNEIYELNYEDMVLNPHDWVKGITAWLGIDYPEHLSQYRTGSSSTSEFNTNKQKSDPNDWNVVLTLEETSSAVDRSRQRLLDIEKYLGTKQVVEFVKQGFQMEDLSSPQNLGFAVKPIKEVRYKTVIIEKNQVQNDTHFVEVSASEENRPIHVAQHLVTNQQFVAFVNYLEKMGISNDSGGNYLLFNPNITANRGGRICKVENEFRVLRGYEYHPVSWVSWIGAISYAQWLGKSLPSVKQWENIARQAIVDEMRNSDNIIGDTTRIDMYPPNNLGIYDFQGNLKAWTIDWFSKSKNDHVEMSSPETFNQKEQVDQIHGLVVVKPGFHDYKSTIIPFSFGEILAGLLDATQLEVIDSCNKLLIDDDVHKLYNSIYGRPPIYQNGLEYRTELLEYMTSGQVTCYLVTGIETNKKLGLIRKVFRGLIDKDPNITGMKNIVHVPDEHELKQSIRIFFENT